LRDLLLDFFPPFLEADLLRDLLLDFFPPFLEADLVVVVVVVDLLLVVVVVDLLLDFFPPFLEADFLRDLLLDFFPLFLEADLLRDLLLDFFPPFLDADLFLERDRPLDFDFPPLLAGLLERLFDVDRPRDFPPEPDDLDRARFAAARRAFRFGQLADIGRLQLLVSFSSSKAERRGIVILICQKKNNSKIANLKR